MRDVWDGGFHVEKVGFQVFTFPLNARNREVYPYSDAFLAFFFHLNSKNRKILIAIFTNIYYNSTVKRIYPSKIFFTNPLLIIYTPLETTGSSPTGCFTL